MTCVRKDALTLADMQRLAGSRPPSYYAQLAGPPTCAGCGCDLHPDHPAAYCGVECRELDARRRMRLMGRRADPSREGQHTSCHYSYAPPMVR